MRMLALSMDAEHQAAILPRSVSSPEEMAEDYDTEVWRMERFGPDDLTPDQKSVSMAVRALLDSITAAKDDSAWDHEALTRPEWAAVREKARLALVTGEWPDVDPAEFRRIFGEPDNEEAYLLAVEHARSLLRGEQGG
jgi:hypothetical protein